MFNGASQTLWSWCDADVSPQTEAMALLDALNGSNVKRPGAKQLSPLEQRQIGTMRMAGLATGMLCCSHVCRAGHCDESLAQSWPSQSCIVCCTRGARLKSSVQAHVQHQHPLQCEDMAQMALHRHVHASHNSALQAL